MKEKEEPLQDVVSKKIKIDKQDSEDGEYKAKDMDILSLKDNLFKKIDEFLITCKEDILKNQLINMKDEIYAFNLVLDDLEDEVNVDKVDTVKKKILVIVDSLVNLISSNRNISHEKSRGLIREGKTLEDNKSSDSEDVDDISEGTEDSNIGSNDEREELHLLVESKKNTFEETSNKSIFSIAGTRTKKTTTSAFLQSGVAKQSLKQVSMESNSNPLYANVIFKERCTLYKYIKKWEKIGTGIVYVIEEEIKRCFFIRDEILSRSIDFNIAYDSKPYKKSNGVGFIYKQTEEGLLKSTNVLLIFDRDEHINKFYQLLLLDLKKSEFGQ